MSKLLINEPPLQVLPSLVIQVGLERAIALQQLHWMIVSDAKGVAFRGEGDDAGLWIKATYREWHAKHFRFWKPETIRKLFNRMVEDGLILSRQFDLAKGDTTTFVSVNYAKLDLTHPDFDAGCHPDFDAEDHPDFDAGSTYSEKESTKKESVRAARVRAQKRVRAPDPRSAHPAIVLARKVCSRFPPTELYDTVISVLGDVPDEVKLTACRRAWLMRGFNAASWVWLVEWYRDGIPRHHKAASDGDNGARGQAGQSLASDSWREAFRMAGMEVTEVADGQ